MKGNGDTSRGNNGPGRPTPETMLVDIKWVAARLGVTVRYVRRLVDERVIPNVKMRHLVRFDPEDIEAWIKAARRPPAS